MKQDARVFSDVNPIVPVITLTQKANIGDIDLALIPGEKR